MITCRGSENVKVAQVSEDTHSQAYAFFRQRNPRTTPIKSTINIASAKKGTHHAFSLGSQRLADHPKKYHLMRKVFCGEWCVVGGLLILQVWAHVLQHLLWFAAFMSQTLASHRLHTRPDCNYVMQLWPLRLIQNMLLA